MKLEARQIDDGRGPYRWRPVMRHYDQLALGGIYDAAHELTDEQAVTAGAMLADRGYEWREVPA